MNPCWIEVKNSNEINVHHGFTGCAGLEPNLLGLPGACARVGACHSFARVCGHGTARSARVYIILTCETRATREELINSIVATTRVHHGFTGLNLQDLTRRPRPLAKIGPLA